MTELKAADGNIPNLVPVDVLVALTLHLVHDLRLDFPPHLLAVDVIQAGEEVRVGLIIPANHVGDWCWCRYCVVSVWCLRESQVAKGNVLVVGEKVD